MPLVSEFYHSEFLAAADLDGRDHVVTIEACKAGKVANDQGKEDDRLIVRLAEFHRSLIINVTNARAIVAVLGGLDNTDAWTARRITIGPSVVKAFGERREAIRVRAKAPAGAHDGTGPPASRVLGPVAARRLDERLGALGATRADLVEAVRRVDPAAADAITRSAIADVDAAFGEAIASALHLLTNPEPVLAGQEGDIPW